MERALLFFLLCMLLASQSFAKAKPVRAPAGAKDGGGGAGISCRSPSQKPGLAERLHLEYYETFAMLEVAEGLKEGDKFQEVEWSVLDYHEFGAKKLLNFIDQNGTASTDDVYLRMAMDFAIDVVAQSMFLVEKIENQDPDMGFTKWGEEFKKEKCEIHWIAYYRDSESMLYISKPYYDRLSLPNLAALYLHESIYRAARLVRNEQNSAEVRRLVRGVLRGDRSILPALKQIFMPNGKPLSEWSDYGMAQPTALRTMSFKAGRAGRMPLVVPKR